MSTGDLARRSLHLKLYPNPTTFVHRREVLRIISNYGEVDMFRSLKYHPISPTANAFAVIFGTQASAQAALNASPIRYRILVSDKNSSTTTATTATMTPDIDEIQEFALHISPTSFCHEKFIMSRFTNPLHGPFFPIHPHMSLIGSSLMQYIKSNSLVGPGLLDWDTDRGRGISRVRNTRFLRTPGTMFKETKDKTTVDRPSMLEQENNVQAKSS